MFDSPHSCCGELRWRVRYACELSRLVFYGFGVRGETLRTGFHASLPHEQSLCVVSVTTAHLRFGLVPTAGVGELRLGVRYVGVLSRWGFSSSGVHGETPGRNFCVDLPNENKTYVQCT